MRTWTVAAAVAAGTLLQACTTGDEPLAPGNQPDALAPPAPLIQGASPDPTDRLRTVSGFGGFFLDDDGRPAVYLRNAARRGDAVRALEPFLASQRLAPSGVRVLPAQYDWAQLEQWLTQISTVILGYSGSVFVDADESSNRVVVGVEPGSAARIKGVLARMAVPPGALTVRETQPIRFAATLRGRIRPAVGGLQINFSGYLCTLGFNAIRSGQRSFITNSHCTTNQGGTEGTRYWQPTQGTTSSIIATEVSDPVFFRNRDGCPSGQRCRFSDASRAAYAAGTNVTLGRIAKTTGANTGSVTISGSFTVTSEGNASVGQTLSKVGRTTGWTRGRLINRCVNVGITGTDIVLLCQSMVSARVGPGDSGSPVFRGSTSVVLSGILWGSNSAGTQFVYSPMSNIERELGALRTF